MLPVEHFRARPKIYFDDTRMSDTDKKTRTSFFHLLQRQAESAAASSLCCGSQELYKRAQCLTECGTDYHRAKQYEDALMCYQEAFDIQNALHPNGSEVAMLFHLIGLLHESQHKLPEALTDFKRALFIRKDLSFHPFDAAISHNKIGMICQKQGNYREALEHFMHSVTLQERLLPHNPLLASAYEKLGAVHQVQDNLDAALECYTNALSIRYFYPKDIESTITCCKSMAETYLLQGNLERALHCYHTVLELKETKIPVDKSEAHKLLILHKKHLASVGEKTLAAANCHDHIGWIEQSLGNTDSALEHYQQSLEIKKLIDPNNVADSYERIGMAYHKQGNLSETVSSYRRSLLEYTPQRRPFEDLEEFFADQLEDLSLTLSTLRSPQALLYIKTMVQNNPISAAIYVIQGRMLLSMNKIGEAMDSFNQALACDPDCKNATTYKNIIEGGVHRAIPKSTSFHFHPKIYVDAGDPCPSSTPPIPTPPLLDSEATSSTLSDAFQQI